MQHIISWLAWPGGVDLLASTYPLENFQSELWRTVPIGLGLRTPWTGEVASCVSGLWTTFQPFIYGTYLFDGSAVTLGSVMLHSGEYIFEAHDRFIESSL